MAKIINVNNFWQGAIPRHVLAPQSKGEEGRKWGTSAIREAINVSHTTKKQNILRKKNNKEEEEQNKKQTNNKELNMAQTTMARTLAVGMACLA